MAKERQLSQEVNDETDGRAAAIGRIAATARSALQAASIRQEQDE